MSDDVVVRAKAALEGITPGPWEWDFPQRNSSDSLISKAESARKPYHAGYVDKDGNTGYLARVLDGVWHNDDTAGIDVTDADAAFIAACVSLVPELVAEVEKLRAWVSVVVEQQDRGVCPVCRYLFSECECRVLP